MGLFDFFRRKSKPQPDQEPTGDDLGEPRCHHYTLAHVALRHVAFADPVLFLGVLASPNPLRFLSDMLRRVTANCRGREDRPDFAVDDMTVHTVRAGHFPCAVIEPSRPRATAEAHMVAAVVLAELTGDLPDGEKPKMRYFTLEKGMTFGSPPRTVLCEWDEGTHFNYGNGPSPEVSAFVAEISAKVSRKE